MSNWFVGEMNNLYAHTYILHKHNLGPVLTQHSFLNEEEERLKAAKVKEGADNTKGKSKKPVAKPKKQPPTVVLDDDSD